MSYAAGLASYVYEALMNGLVGAGWQWMGSRRFGENALKYGGEKAVISMIAQVLAAWCPTGIASLDVQYLSGLLLDAFSKGGLKPELVDQAFVQVIAHIIVATTGGAASYVSSQLGGTTAASNSTTSGGAK